MELYPIQFEPIFKEKIWGGRRLGSFLSTRLPADTSFGESWNIVDREGEHVSTIENGWCEGQTLKEYIEQDPDAVLGSEAGLDRFGRFPLMVKFLDAEENLSLQVHPGDEYARMNENDAGKLEAWYILEAEEDAEVIRGVLPGVSKEELVNALREDRPMDVLNSIDVHPGDVILVPPGIIHAIGGGVLLCEVEQNSDVTYRLHDWNRLGPDGESRELHLDQAMDVIDLQAMGRTRTRSSEIEGPWEERELLVKTPVFQMEKIVASSSFDEIHSPESYHLNICVSGSGYFTCDTHGETPFSFEQGNCFLMPADLDEYTVDPNDEMTLLKITPAEAY